LLLQRSRLKFHSGIGKAMRLHPFSETGASAIVLSSENYYAADFLVAHVRVEGGAIKSILPKVFQGGEEVLLSIRDFVTIMGNREDLLYEEPSLTQYKEGAVGVKVGYEGKSYQYYPYMWVDKDFALVRGWINGFPKKMAEISMTRFHPLLDQLSAPRRGAVIGGYAVRGGSPLLRLKVELLEEVERPPSFGPTILIRDYPSEGEGEAEVLELVELKVQDLRFSDVWRGKAEVQVGGGVNDEMNYVKVLQPISGYYYRTAFKVTGTRLLRRLKWEELF
jgi:acetoacetate decarboxylase